MRVFLTGGSGLIGSHVAEQLRGSGHDVTCLQRSSSDTRYLESLGCQIQNGDIQDSRDRIARAAEGCDVVIHGAALVYAGLPWETIHDINVEGTRRVLEGAAAAGVGRAVHLSSVSAYGPMARWGEVDESTPLDEPIAESDFYGRSKRESETAAREAADRTDLPVTIVRPAAIYGPRDRLFAPILARFARLPLIPLLGSGTSPLPVVYVGNLAAALIRSSEGEGEGVRVYNVGSDHPIGTRDLIGTFARGLGRTPRFVSIPQGVAKAAAGTLQKMTGILGLSSDFPLERAVRLATGGNPYRTERIRTELEWVPPFTHDEGVAATTRWLRTASGK